MNAEEVNELAAQGKYAYKWSLNISINPFDKVLLIVWWKENQYLWRLRSPLHIELNTLRGDWSTQ